MANKPTYFELLQHPKWQRKRLEVLNRAKWACESCGDSEKTLHVHHTYYEKGLMPWEYPSESLRCLCADCHREQQDKMTLLQRQIGRADEAGLEKLLGYSLAVASFNYPGDPISISSYECAMGVGHFWGLSAEEVIAALREGVIDGWTLYKLSKPKNGPAIP